MPKKDSLEQKALDVIATKGDNGILQCNLWKELRVSSREGSRISRKLEKKALINREKELYNSRWTYRIFIKKRALELESVLDVPCILCLDISKCEGSAALPNSCIKLTEWLLTKSKERANDEETLF